MIRKAIIPVAGYGTRFLPYTKATPKEMLPIIDKPVIQYVVEEAVASGITEIILVTNSSKRAVEDHFDNNYALEKWLEKKEKKDALEAIKSISNLANFVYIRQKGPYGNATPILNAEHLIGDEPFAVLFGDELIVNPKPRLKQMIEVFDKYQDPILGVIDTDDEGTKKYGIIDPVKELEDDVLELRGVMEKPGPEKAASRLASIGAYILTPDIFNEIKNLEKGHGGELVLLDAVFKLMKKRSLYAKKLEGRYYDTGSKLGWLEANIGLGLERADLKDEIKKMINKFDL